MYDGEHYLRRSRMKHDRKYARVSRCFAPGVGNPVPLATVAPFVTRSGAAAVAFVDGITRTLYLLANGATAFPVVVAGAAAAALLHAAAGVGPAEAVALLHDVSMEDPRFVHGRREAAPQRT